MVILFVLFWGTTKLLSIANVPFYILTSNAHGSQLFHILLLFSGFVLFFFSLVAVSGCEVAFHSVVVCVSLLISDIDRIFMCLLAELAIYLQSELLTLPICSLFIWASFAFVPLNLKSSFLLRVAEHFPDLMEFVISFSDLRLTFRKMEGWGGVKTGSRAHYRGIT